MTVTVIFWGVKEGKKEDSILTPKINTNHQKTPLLEGNSCSL